MTKFNSDTPVVDVDLNLDIKNLRKSYFFSLKKTSGEIIGEIPSFFCISLERKLNDIDELVFVIPKYIQDRYTREKRFYYLFAEMRNERVIGMNDEDFIIKEIKDNKDGTIEVKSYSKEKKLSKIAFRTEEVYISPFTTDMENDILSLDDLLYEQVGWRVGHVDENVGYLTYTNENGEQVKEERIRWQENVNMNWYDFLRKNITDQFDCFVFFNTKEKTVNLYDRKSFGERLGLYLAKDQYIRSITKTTESNNILTRLELVGEKDQDITGATASGYSYVENYSYYIENRLMSDRLIAALELYFRLVEERTVIWNQLQEEKFKKQAELLDKQRDMTSIQAHIIAATSMIESYREVKDAVNEAMWIGLKAKYIDEETILYQQIKALELEIQQLDEAIKNITILCKKETAPDENGILIFDQELLDELKEFISLEIWQEESFIDTKDFIEAGKNKLEKRCRPTDSFTISVDNFLGRLLDNHFRQHWNGKIGLGDVIILYEKDREIESYIYLVGFKQDFKSNLLSLSLSNKKNSTDDARDIADYLRDAKFAKNNVNSKNYLWQREKYHRF